ncbi:alpha/beta fold hydrolase [Candidatus Foliamicus sp.]
MKILVAIVGLVALALLLTYLGLTQWSKISREALIEQYRLEESQFISVDGVELHVRDTGSGPAVLLLHGHAGNLRMWQAWTEALDDAYRVISFDIPGYGLTGSDPSGDYSVDRAAELAMGLMDALGIERFYAGGTSIGSIAAFRITSRYPERIPALILANAAGLPREPGKGPNQPDPNPLRQLLYSYHFPYSYFETFFERTWHDPSKAPEELVRQYYDMARRKGAQEEGALSLQQFRTGDPETVLGRITQPVLLLWSQSRVLPSTEPQRFIDFLKNTAVEYHPIPDAGHVLPLEGGAASAPLVRTFLDRLESTAREAGEAEPVPAAGPAQAATSTN